MDEKLKKERFDMIYFILCDIEQGIKTIKTILVIVLVCSILGGCFLALIS